MPNIEIKAKCSDPSKAKILANKLKTNYLGHLHQMDTYYETKQGRLKLREINNTQAFLIPYYKDYSLGPMKSNYALLDVKDIQTTKNILEHILGVVTVVDKNREVFLIENIRVHLDQVKGLGNFIEFEAVYNEDTEEAKNREIYKVKNLMQNFGIQQDDLLDKSYIDYLLTK